MSDSIVSERQKFKRTPIGNIPVDWAVKSIGELAECVSGGTPNTSVAEYWNGKIRWMNSGELNLKWVEEVEGRITQEGLDNSSAKILPPKCVLIGLAGQGKTRGTAAINLVELCTNQSIAAILPNSAFVPEYLYYNLDSRYDELRRLSGGESGRGGLNLSTIRSLLIPLPPISEQQKIADLLRHLDDAVMLGSKTLDRLRMMRKSVQGNLVSGKARVR
jgi:type I restriction enzyme S subunit